MFRDIEQIEYNIELAKLNKENILLPYQSIYFSEEIHNDDIKLIELDNTVLEDILSGKRYVFRGKDDDSAVICSKDKTFNIKEAETSNMLLIFDELIDSKDEHLICDNLIQNRVLTVKQVYYEMKQCKPYVKRVQELLEENIFDGTQFSDNYLYAIEDLQSLVQASDKEIIFALEKLEACEINGYWRILDLDFKSTIIRTMMSIIDESVMPYNDLDILKLKLALLEHYQENIVNYIIEKYTQQNQFQNQTLLNEYMMCRLNAEIILSTAEKFNLREFLQVWQLSVPDGLNTDMQQLTGLAIIDKYSQPEQVIYFPITRLQNNIEERFYTLFKVKDYWTLQEITPYIEDICALHLNIGNLLMKFCRVSTLNGEKVYSSKKPIKS